MAFETYITPAGLAALAAAAAGGDPVALAEMAFGDGAAAPDPGQPELQNEVHRAPLNSLAVHPDHPDWIVAACAVGAEPGGWWVREVGIFTAGGELFAVGSYPEVYKPAPAEGASRDLFVRMILAVGNAANVTLQIDPSVVLVTVEQLNAHADSAENPHQVTAEQIGAERHRPAFRYFYSGL